MQDGDKRYKEEEEDRRIAIGDYDVLDSPGEVIRPGDEPRPAPAYVSLTIIGLCVAMLIVTGLLVPPLAYVLGFSPGMGLVFPGIITHMFVHANTYHLLGNMLVLYFLGTAIEQRYGAWRFVALYFAAGLLAALAQAAVAPDELMVGASGALAGVMAAFVRHYPRTMLYLYALIPIPAWLFIVLWLGYNLVGAGGALKTQIAFVAHLGGFAAGMLLSLMLEPPRFVKA